MNRRQCDALSLVQSQGCKIFYISHNAHYVKFWTLVPRCWCYPNSVVCSLTGQPAVLDLFPQLKLA